MSTTADPNLTQDPSSIYDPDEVLPKNSPILAQYKPNLRPSPSPPPFYSLAKAGSPTSGHKRPNRPKIQPSQGDAVLIAYLGGGRLPEIAAQAGSQVLPSDPEEGESPISDTSESSRGGAGPQPRPHFGGGMRKGSQGPALEPQEGQGRTMATDTARRPDAGAFDLKSLAAGALAFTQTTNAEAVGEAPALPVARQGAAKEKRHAAPIPAAITTRRDDPPHLDDRSPANAGPSPFSPRSSIYSPRDPGHLMQHKADLRSPTAMPPNLHGGLPPIQMVNSPRSETNGQTPLPSIRAHLGLGDWKGLSDPAVDKDGNLRHATFPHSPPPSLPGRFPSIQRPHHGSPPISPAETFRQELPSPGHALAPPGINNYNYYHQPNGLQRQNPDYSSSNTATPNTDQSGSTPATSIADRLSIDGITNPANGAFVCKEPGCNAPAFQTQYLLNSHANVHSSARPHYCPVPGCSRSEGGKGFKRKNEMIRHGLVHDSPGYVCPFCPDREHRYPRPDNLQRYVRPLIPTENQNS